MPKLLSEAEVAAYRERGYHYPVNALSESEVSAFRKKLEDYEAGSGGPIKGEMRHRSHVLFTWINEMIRHPKILDAVEDLLGPNILCWNTSFFIKEAHDPGFVVLELFSKPGDFALAERIDRVVVTALAIGRDLILAQQFRHRFPPGLFFLDCSALIAGRTGHSRSRVTLPSGAVKKPQWRSCTAVFAEVHAVSPTRNLPMASRMSASCGDASAATA